MGWFDWLKRRPSGPKFDPRPEISGPKVIETPSIPEGITVIFGVADFERSVLGRTESKNGRILCRIDESMERPYNPANEEKWKNQLLQVVMHELIHCLLWHRTDFSHSPDKTSIMYYIVRGETLTPNKLDLQMMDEAASKIASIIVEIPRDFEVGQYWNIYSTLKVAINRLNTFLGKTEFFLKQE